jgi:CRP/FNR family cyclic AMP-dependent transcriptional regulator
MIRNKFDLELAEKIIKSVPLFESLSDQQLSSLLERTNVNNYGKDEVIMMAGEEANQMYVVLKGQIRVVNITEDGQERVMAFRHRGDCFGDMGLLDNRTDSATVIANEPSKVLFISKNVFDDIFLVDKLTLLRVIEILCGRLRECWQFHNIIGINNAESKVRATLSHYSKTLGIEDSSGVIINATISQQSIADRIHITRETVTRVLHKMKNQHEIEMVGRRYKLLPSFFQTYEMSELFKTLKLDLISQKAIEQSHT